MLIRVIENPFPGAVKMQDLIYSMKKEMLRRKYSIKTITTYVYCINKFFRKYNNKELKKINKKDITDYLHNFKSGNTINVYLNALKFFFQEILRKRLTIKIRYSKTPKKLPEYLTKYEIVKLFNSIKNKKHKLIVKLLYSAGLRVGEVVRLRIRDFQFDNDYGLVRHGKGNKDRIFIIAKKLKKEIIDFIKENKINYNDYLFKGYKGHLSIRSVQNIVKEAAKRAKINKNCCPHILRHSFATHLIENNHSIVEVQPLLGHKNITTTMTYLHISPKFINIQSPFDSL